jgi:hypothetical protein
VKSQNYGDILAPFSNRERAHDQARTEPSGCLAFETVAASQ